MSDVQSKPALIACNHDPDGSLSFISRKTLNRQNRAQLFIFQGLRRIGQLRKTHLRLRTGSYAQTTIAQMSEALKPLELQGLRAFRPSREIYFNEKFRRCGSRFEAREARLASDIVSALRPRGARPQAACVTLLRPYPVRRFKSEGAIRAITEFCLRPRQCRQNVRSVLKSGKSSG